MSARGVYIRQQKRRFWGAEGVKRVHEATQAARCSILAGMKELKQGITPERIASQRVRRSGAGRKKLIEQDSGLREALERLVESGTRALQSQSYAGHAKV